MATCGHQTLTVKLRSSTHYQMATSPQFYETGSLQASVLVEMRFDKPANTNWNCELHTLNARYDFG